MRGACDHGAVPSDPRALRDAYDEQLRGPAEMHRAVSVTVDGPLHRGVFSEGRGFVTYRSLDGITGTVLDRVLEISNPGEPGVALRIRPPKEAPLKPLREYAQKVVELRRRGLV